MGAFLDDLESAKEMSNENSSSDPKTVCFNVKDRCLTFDQGTSYFMPSEIHSGVRYAKISTNSQSSSDEEDWKVSFFSLLICARQSSDTNTITTWNH